MGEKLLPCPFCGAPPIVTEAGGICCENMDCPAIVGVPNKHFTGSGYEPAKAWNTRAEPLYDPRQAQGYPSKDEPVKDKR